MDYLLWTVIDVGATFADAAMTPDVEHLCLAALSLEQSALGAPKFRGSFVPLDLAGYLVARIRHLPIPVGIALVSSVSEIGWRLMI